MYTEGQKLEEVNEYNYLCRYNKRMVQQLSGQLWLSESYTFMLLFFFVFFTRIQTHNLEIDNTNLTEHCCLKIYTFCNVHCIINKTTNFL